MAGMLINNTSETTWDTFGELAFVNTILGRNDSSETTGVSILELTLITESCFFGSNHERTNL